MDFLQNKWGFKRFYARSQSTRVSPFTYRRHPLNTEQTTPCYHVHHFIVPLFPKIQLSLSKFLRSGDFFSTSPYSCRFHCDLSPSLIGWEFITYKFVCSAGFRRREKDFCGLYLEIFLSIISRRCFAYFAVDRLFTRLSSVCKGILFSLFSVFCLNWSY